MNDLLDNTARNTAVNTVGANAANHAPNSAGASAIPTPPAATSERVPNTSMLPGTEKVPSLDLDLSERGGQHATADRMTELRDRWVEATRSNVRYSPLTALAAAVALGALIARVMRR